MRKINLSDIENEYDLELDRVVSDIKKNNPEKVLLQFPDGLKQYSNLIVDYLREKTSENIEFFIWFGSCFGACETPVLTKDFEEKIDLVIQFGHNEVMPSY